jgi:hypothetical protein
MALSSGSRQSNKGGAGAHGEAGVAGAAGEQAAPLAGPIAERDPAVAVAAEAIVGAGGVLTTEVLEVVHGAALGNPVVSYQSCRRHPAFLDCR